MLRTRIKLIAYAVVVCFLMTGCFGPGNNDKTERNSASSHKNREEDNKYDAEKKLVVYNSINNEVVVEICGHMNISDIGYYMNVGHTEHGLRVTCKVGSDDYVEHFVSINEFTSYTIEEILENHSDPWYHCVTYYHGD